MTVLFPRPAYTLQLVPAKEPGGTDMEMLMAVGREQMLSAFHLIRLRGGAQG
jgi:hypothetical protein